MKQGKVPSVLWPRSSWVYILFFLWSKAHQSTKEKIGTVLIFLFPLIKIRSFTSYVIIVVRNSISNHVNKSEKEIHHHMKFSTYNFFLTEHEINVNSYIHVTTSITPKIHVCTPYSCERAHSPYEHTPAHPIPMNLWTFRSNVLADLEIDKSTNMHAHPP